MGDWTAWSKCPCGIAGVRKRRSRTAKSFPTGYGIRCPRDNVQYTTCEKIHCKCTTGYYGDLCQDRDCTLTSWTKWSKCTPCPPTCDGDLCPTTFPKHQYRSRERRVHIHKAGNGKCEGERRQTAYCGYCKADCDLDFISKSGRVQMMVGSLPKIVCYYTRDYVEPIQ